MRYLLLCLALFCLACPDPQDPPEHIDEDYRELVERLSWNPYQLFPDIELPKVLPDPVPELDEIPGDALQIGLDNIGTGEILSSLPFNFIVLQGGDYSHLGRIPITSSGSPVERRVLYCPTKDCYLDALELQDADYWVFAGIQFRSEHNTTGDITFTQRSKLVDSDYVVFHDCHWTNLQDGIRIYGNYNTVQLCSFSDKPLHPSDIGGVTIYARDGKESRGNRIIFNEFKGLSDGAGAPWDTGGDGGSTPATIIAFNTSWIPEDLYRTLIVKDEQGNEHRWDMACAEDGYDFKNGAITDDPEDTSYFIGNMSRGHRPTDQSCGGSGSTGNSWIFHRRARNWIIRGNLSLDDFAGAYVKGYNPGGKDLVQNIRMDQNAFIQLGGTFPGGIAGYRENLNERLAIRMHCPSCTATDNLVSGAQYDYYTKNVEATIEDNTLIRIEQPTDPQLVTYETEPLQISLPASPLLDPENILQIMVQVPK